MVAIVELNARLNMFDVLFVRIHFIAIFAFEVQSLHFLACVNVQFSLNIPFPAARASRVSCVGPLFDASSTKELFALVAANWLLNDESANVAREVVVQLLVILNFSCV